MKDSITSDSMKTTVPQAVAGSVRFSSAKQIRLRRGSAASSGLLLGVRNGVILAISAVTTDSAVRRNSLLPDRSTMICGHAF